ncbi:MAG TPA: hypothetical protein VGX25_08725, partial [Actinophytocola sp.]|nr:hypothetical protein [Actinophytocola sp.]
SGYYPAPPVPPVDNGGPREAATEQMPRVPPAGPQQSGAFPPARIPFGHAGAMPPAPPLGPEANGDTQVQERYPDDYTDFDVEDELGPPGYQDYPEDEDADADEFADDDELAGDRSPAREWLIMAGQVAVSVVGGAAVWLGFNWLWGKFPQVALGAALAVIVGLVWIVRKIRRADDLQTTGLAVLVGLFVTVSPAALLLLSR